jgi:hypothetical protein
MKEIYESYFFVYQGPINQMPDFDALIATNR